MKLQPVKGTKDILPEDYTIFLHIIEVARQVARNYGYKEFDIPALEYTEVFSRSLGDASEIVNKEMYTFEDRKGRSLTLRPEFTAGIVRSVISNSLQNDMPLKLFTAGALFRYERPQRGRYRQFYQINFENIGDCDPIADAETIALADNILKQLKLDNITLEINTLGDSASRQSYTNELVSYFKQYKNDLSADSKIRLTKNPLRILDSKDEKDKKIIAKAPSIQNFLTPESDKFFKELLKNLDDLGVKYKVNPKLVRGLDYYTNTVFEFTTSELGAQGTVLAGGRYDNLVKQIGGRDIPAIGFAAGIERLMELFKEEIKTKRGVSIVLLDQKFNSLGLKLAQKIRSKNIAVVIEKTTNVAKVMKKSLANNAKFIVFIGEEEAKQNKFTVKDLDKYQESLLTFEQLIDTVSRYEF
jgi:histidyl-tRNA synthetase